MRRTSLIVLWAALATGGSARAHEILTGVGSQAIFKVHPSEIVVEFNVQYAHFHAYQELLGADRNRDHSLGDDERTALTDSILQRVLSETGLFLDGRKLEPKSTELTDNRAILKGPIEMLPFEVWWLIRYDIPPLEPGRMHSLVYLDNTYEGEVAQQDFWVQMKDIHVDNLVIKDPEPTFEFESYRVRGHRRVEMEIGVLESEEKEAAAVAAPPPSFGDDPVRPPVQRSEQVDEMEKARKLFDRAKEGFVGFVAALVLAMVLGAGHALMPGHGKSMVAAYLVGSRGRVRDAVLLGGVATFAHTFVLFLIGGLLIWVFYETMDRSRAAFEAWISVGSGLLVLLLGAFLLVRRIRALRNPEIDEAHARAHARGEPHGHSHGHHHHHHDHHHHDHHHHGEERLHTASLVSLGFSGGMIPCPTGLVIVLTSFQLKEPVLGLVLLTTFSAGLGTVLVTIGVSLVLTKSTLAARTGIGKDSRLIRALPVVSAVLVTLVGAWLTYTSGLDGYDKGIFRPLVDGLLSWLR